jgi:serine/threonine protein kinase
VCIKVFSKFPDDPGVWRTAYEHFVQEAFALSRLTHPNTLRIYDFGHLPGGTGDMGTPLQVSEFMNGGTLSQLVRERGAQPIGETLRMATALCEALDEAHEVGLVHRDIKPQNILFASAGGARVAKLADFGIAKWRDVPREPSISVDFSERAGDTQVVAGVKMAMYSPSWAAPEQLAGKVIAPPADIYSLGVVIVYMLTGRAIFAEEDVQRGYRKRRRVEEVLRDAIGKLRLPSEAVAVLAHALAFEPEERPRRASDLAHELTEAFEPRTTELPRQVEGSGRTTVPLPNDLAAEAMPPSAAGIAASRLGMGLAEATRESSRLRRLPEKPERPERPERDNASGQPGELPPPPVTPARPIEAVAQPAPAAAVTPIAPGPTGVASSSTTAKHALPRRVAPTGGAQRIGDRQLRFSPAPDGIVDVPIGDVRVRVTLMPDMEGRRPVHLKGVSCFVARRGGRPTAAVLIDRDGDFDLVSPRSQVIAGGRLARGSPAAGHTVFQIGTELVAIGVDDCPDPVLIDWGPGGECHIIYAARRVERRRGSRSSDSP